MANPQPGKLVSSAKGNFKTPSMHKENIRQLKTVPLSLSHVASYSGEDLINFQLPRECK